MNANESKDIEISKLADNINRLEENVWSFDSRKRGYRTCLIMTREEQISKPN